MALLAKALFTGEQIMARRKRKQKSSILGALVIEALAVVVFVLLIAQARAERQQESGLENSGAPVLKEMLEQTPFRALFA